MKIIIVDDDILVTTALKTILEASGKVEVLATGSDGSEAVTLFDEYQPDILLTDIQMKHMSGLEATEKILKKYPEAKILLLTTFLDDEYIVKALKFGAKGYILKQDYSSIIPALEALMNGQTVFGNEIINKIPELLSNSPKFNYEKYGISDKEFNIIELIANGLSNKEIAQELFLSEGTVRNYLSTILEKLELRDRTQLAIFYYQHR